MTWWLLQRLQDRGRKGKDPANEVQAWGKACVMARRRISAFIYLFIYLFIFNGLLLFVFMLTLRLSFSFVAVAVAVAVENHGIQLLGQPLLKISLSVLRLTTLTISCVQC